MKCCGNCLHRRIVLYGPGYDKIELRCAHGYRLNTLLNPFKRDCWEKWHF